MYSISSSASTLLRYLGGKSLAVATVSGIPGNRLTSPGGLDGGSTGGDGADTGEVAGAGLATIIFSASSAVHRKQIAHG